MNRRNIYISITAVVLVMIVAYLGVGYFIFQQIGDVEGSCDRHLVSYPDYFVNPGDPNDPEDGHAWPEFDMSPYFMPNYEDVRFPSRETNFEIAGWYVAGDPDMPAVILLDGLGGCKHAIAALVPAGMLWRNGFNVLIIDLHETGDSQLDDGYSTIGNDEYLDVLGAWDWLREEKGFDESEIGVAANSLGSVTSFYAFVEEPRMAAIFLNSPFANFPEIVATELGRNGFPAFLGAPTLQVGSLITGQNLTGRSPLEAMTHTGGRPIFVVHSADDNRIDISHSYQLEEVAREVDANATFWYIDGVDHVRAPATHTEEFERRIVDFFTASLGGQ